VKLVLGALFLLFALPPVAVVVGGAVLWHYIDPITPAICMKLRDLLEPYGKKVARRPEDSFLLGFMLKQGVFIPLFSFYCLWSTLNHGLSWKLVYLFQLVRIGPYFTSFAYAYTLCHKEGHTKRIGMFKSEYWYFANVWNWWIGLFYGVMPSSFALGHTVNHHKYDNQEDDNVTTWDYPRDNFQHYVAYLPRWLAYHGNVSTVMQFYKEGETKLAGMMLVGTGFYWAFFGLFYRISPAFAVCYLGYPLIESSLLLSAINWAWHCFLDPDEDNIYGYSVTLFGSTPQTNILNEDYHVVHHQYPGAHWTEHPRLYEKHKEEYIKNQATMLNETHAVEIFFLSILKKYDVFAEKFVDLSGQLTMQQKEDLVKTRLRTCTWGPNANTIQAKKRQAAAEAQSKKTK
jgi:hypothetical protein